MLTHKKTIMAKVGSVVLPHGWDRGLDANNVALLKDSMSRVGQIQAITLDMKNQLRSGRHRYAAARELGWATIRADVLHAVTEAEQEAAEIYENLARREIPVAERVGGTAKLAKLLGVVPEARGTKGARGIVAQVAAATGRSEPTVRLDLKLGEALGDKVADLEAAGVPRPVQAEIADMPPEERPMAVAAAIEDALDLGGDDMGEAWEDGRLMAVNDLRKYAHEKVAAAVAQAKRAWRSYLDAAEADRVPVRRSGIADALDAVTEALAGSRFDVACPACRHMDAKCKACKGSGYVTATESEAM